MASNEVEVLDPAATVEKMKEIASGVVLNRRHFMAALGAAGVAVGTGLVTEPAARAQAASPPGFSQVDVVNFLLLVKYVTATYLSFLTQGADLPSPTLTTAGSGAVYGTGQVYNQPAKLSTASSAISAQNLDMLNEMYYDDVNDLIALRNLLINLYPAGTPVGETAVLPRPTMNLAGTSTPNGTFSAPSATMTQTGPQAIAQARMLKDLSVTAFTNALQYFTGANLATVAQILAVEGYHAAMLRLATIQTGAPFQSSQFGTSFQVGTLAGSTTVYAISTLPTTVAVGQALTGTGIPSGAVITAVSSTASATPTGLVTKGSTTITNLSSLSGLFAGQPITGTNIPALTYITAVGTNTITISQAPTGTVSNLAPTGYLTAGSSTLTGTSSISGLIVGQPVTGPTFTFGAIATSGSSTLTSVTNLAGLGVGQPISGTGIPSGATIAATGNTGTAPVVAYTVTMSANATSSAATTVTATIIPVSPATTIAAASGTTVTFSTPALGSTTATTTGIVTSGSTAITGITNTSVLTAGQPISGAGIPAGATVKTITGTTANISSAATATSTFPTFAQFQGIVVSGSTTISQVAVTSGTPTPGQPLFGTGIAPATVIVSYNSGAGTITMSAPATATSTVSTTAVTTTGSTALTTVYSISGLIAGQPISGTGIPSGTTISTQPGSISGSTVIMSAAATSSSGTTLITLTSNTIETIVAGGEVLITTATGAISSPQAQALAIGKSTTTISVPASLSASTTAVIVTPDPLDVAPVDPGSAAAAAAGPAPDVAWNSSTTYSAGQVVTYGGVYYVSTANANVDNVPASSTDWQVTSSASIVYQGFFDTAGTGNATGSAPAGFAYARTFSQVLGVLFTSNAPGTFDGGFYPVSLSSYGYAISAVSSA